MKTLFLITAALGTVSSIVLYRLAKLVLLYAAPAWLAGVAATQLAHEAGCDPILTTSLAWSARAIAAITMWAMWGIMRLQGAPRQAAFCLLSMPVAGFFALLWFFSTPQQVSGDGHWFTAEGGKARLYYAYQPDNEVRPFQFFSRAGTHPKLGLPLAPVTPEVRTAYEEWKRTGKLPLNLLAPQPQPVDLNEPVNRRTSQVPQSSASLGEQCSPTNGAEVVASHVAPPPAIEPQLPAASSAAKALSSAPQAPAASAVDNLLNQQMEVEFAGVRFRSVARELLHTAFAGRANELEQLKARANGSAEELYRLAAVAAGWTIEPSLSPKAAVDKLLDQQFERESAGVRFRSVARALLQTSFAGRAEELERLKQRANGSGEELLRLAQGSSPAQ